MRRSILAFAVVLALPTVPAMAQNCGGLLCDLGLISNPAPPPPMMAEPMMAPKPMKPMKRHRAKAMKAMPAEAK